MHDWPLKTIAECAADEPYSTQIGPFGKALTPDAYIPAGVPLLRGVNVNNGRFYDDDYVFISEADADRLAKFESFPGDVLLVHKGSLGKIGLMPKNRRFARYIMGNSMLRVKCDVTKLLPDFLRYWLQSPDGQSYLLGRVSQVGVPQIQRPLTTLREAALPVPPLMEQQAIVGILGALDDKIEQNRRTGRKLEELARAVFKAWFVDFEPVKAKSAGAKSFPGMPRAAFAALPSRMIDSKLGPVPEGWPVKPIANAFEVNPARRLAKGQDAPYLDMKNMPTDGHAPDKWEKRPHGSGMRFINGDTLVARITPCLENGKTAFVDFLNDGEVAWGSTEYIVLRPKPPLPEVFAYCLARNTEFREFAIQNMTGTSGRQRVAATALDHFQAAIPDARTAQGFGEVVSPLFECIRAAKNESAKLAALRDYLLPRLLSGRVRVQARATDEVS
jgi:type I restriction enzyme S subunit